jgi:hypothetical protein
MIKIRISIAALMWAMAFVLYSILIPQIMPKTYAAAPPTPVATPASTPTATPSSLWTEEDMRAVFPEKYASPKPPVRLLKSRVVTNSPEDMGDVSKAELDQVLKAIKVIKWSRNADPVAAANEDYKSIVKYCADHNVDLTADLVTEAASGNYGNDDANARYQMTMG